MSRLTARRKPELFETSPAALTNNDVGPGRRWRARDLWIECEETLVRIQIARVPSSEGTEKSLRFGAVGAALGVNSGRPSSMHGDETSGTPKPFVATQGVAPFASVEPYEPYATSDTSAAYSRRAASRISLRRKLAAPSSSVCGMSKQ
ncbi:hypothetical protein DFH11DRAFT_1728709 [Phellopilus nigrolimitatus]|nr:hypothetical protein DFH11DRAFT_1728709 [Phellopilus nigrolimitatus]